MEKLSAEFDQLTDHLAKSLGPGKRTRKLDDAGDRAQPAVTLCIRSAIRKARHPSPANHLSHALRTGTFCTRKRAALAALRWISICRVQDGRITDEGSRGWGWLDQIERFFKISCPMQHFGHLRPWVTLGEFDELDHGSG
jgi:hypothetical protein